MPQHKCPDKARARELGLTTYPSAKPCLRGHVGRRVSHGACYECALILQRARMAALTPEQQMVRREKRRIAYHERHRAKHLEWLAANRARCLDAEREWNSKNRDRVRLKNRNRKARRRGAKGKYTPEDIAEIRRLQGDRCAYCRIGLRKGGTIDHILAITRGGSNERANLQMLCRPCNSSKRARCAIEFAQSRGMLL